MKARMFLFTVIASLMMVSCTKYYRVVEDDTPIYDELDEGSEVLATLKAGEVVYAYVTMSGWVQVHRSDSSGVKGWTRQNKLVLLEGEAKDSLGDLAEEARHARKQAVINAEQRHKDSVIAVHPNIYYRVVPDSLEIYTRDMGTKDGQENGKKVGALEHGRIVGNTTADKTQGWIFVHTADEAKRMSGYVEMGGLERVSQAENDSLNSIAYDNTKGYVFKSLHPTLMWVCIATMVLALGLFVWMLLQQRARHLWYGTLLYTYLGSIIIVFFAAGSMDDGLDFGWCYRLLPAAWSTLVMFPLLYTDIKRGNMRRIANLIYWLMVPMCFILYAHHQDGSLWPPFKMYLLNALVYFWFVSGETSFKCPYCGKYGGHENSRTVYEGRFTRHDTVDEYHSAQTVKTETSRDWSSGRDVTTHYVSPAYWSKKIVSTTVDIFTHYKRCYNCGNEFKFSTEEKVV